MESLSEVNMYKQDIDAFMQKVAAKHGHEKEFLQAVLEVAETVIPYIKEKLSASAT